MKTLKILAALTIFLTIYSCSDKDAENYDKLGVTKNKFTDETLQEIYDLQNERNTKGLMSYFESSNAKNREVVALAFGSVQDAAALNNLFFLLEEDKSEKVSLVYCSCLSNTFCSFFNSNPIFS